MSLEEWHQFLEDLKVAMLLRYNEKQANAIVQWFNMIRSSHEYDLIGTERMTPLLEMLSNSKIGFDMYQHTMARAWVYAPYILKEEGLLDGDQKEANS